MHDLNKMTDGRYSFAYVGRPGWHGLGQEVRPNAPLEEIAKAAGYDYTIEASRVAYRWGAGKGEVGVMDDRRVLWRSDTHEPLAVVSARYRVVQPIEVLEFFRDLLTNAGGRYQMETAGVLGAGAEYWALARYAHPITVGRDVIRPYLLLTTACDGSRATTVGDTSERIVCRNTLQIGLRDMSERTVRVRHSTRFDADLVKAQLGLREDAYAQFESDVHTLIDRAISRTDTVDLLVDQFGKRDGKGNITNERGVKRIVTDIMRCLDHGPGADMETARGTAWGVVNAVTHWADFRAPAQSAENRFRSAQFGSNAAVKRDVARTLLDLA